MSAPAGMWECPNCGRNIRDDWDSCPHCHTSKKGNSPIFSEPTERSYKTSSPAKHEKEKASVETYITEPSNTVGGSWAAKFLKFIGWLMIILGILVAWHAGNAEQVYSSLYGYSSRSEFDVWAFIIAYIPYLLGGAFSLCVSELFENIQRIADSLSKMKTTKR